MSHCEIRRFKAILIYVSGIVDSTINGLELRPKKIKVFNKFLFLCELYEVKSLNSMVKILAIAIPPNK